MTTNPKTSIASTQSDEAPAVRKNWSTPQIIISEVVKRTHKINTGTYGEYHLTTTSQAS